MDFFISTVTFLDCISLQFYFTLNNRGNTEFLKIHPCQKETLSSIYYELDGKIGASDPEVQYDLTNTLNLNCPSSSLTSERKAALDSLIAELGVVNEADELEVLDYCKDALKIFEEETDNKTPYVGILIWYLQTMIKKLEDQM